MEFFTAEDFEPAFFSGGPARLYLPILRDVVVHEKPSLIVTLGLSDAQAHLAFCQTMVEKKIAGRCIAIRRARTGEADDPATGAIEAAHYREISEIITGDAAKAAERLADGTIDLLFIDDIDCGEALRHELGLLLPKLSSRALLLCHGINLERADPPRRIWSNLPGEKREFSDGIGLGIRATEVNSSPLRAALMREPLAAMQNCRLGVQLITARVRLRQAEQKARVLSARQVWFDTVMQDRDRAQVVMDELQKQRHNLQHRFANLQTDRSKAQLVIDTQAARIQTMAASLDLTRDKLDELKQLVTAAKKNCRRGGRCFDVPKDKVRRSVGEKIARELGRLPRNTRQFVSRLRNQQPAPAGNISADPRYAEWILNHEPYPAALKAQSDESNAWSDRPQISLLIPLFDTPAKFLDELFASLATQTYSRWEACVVDGGSSKRATTQVLARWEKRESRIRVKRLKKNLGVAENTNEALREAMGDFVALVDHDDLLPPFALYQLASAIRRESEAEMFYSDEDRLSESGLRAKPFFKPEWSPELLFSLMYIGHLTAYRRDFALGLDGFCKEFDLSQDYDFALRATERARKIVHIPHVLYHWREHPASGASGGKPEARKSNIAALAGAVRRRGLDAEVLEYPTANRVRMHLRTPPRVSIIIPTDSSIRAQSCARDLPKATQYADAEFIVVTNSALIEQLRASEEPISDKVRLVAFDLPFNFSAKCNAGARAATGQRFIFLNDDVEASQRDWIENLIEPLENPEVGAVAPKLLYSTGRIQHAGLVTGVRGLVGTAMHQWPADSTEYANFAQSMRTVSALSAACLAMRRDDFSRIGEFDELNTPIADSDFDLCFKIREAGLRCVYTPFVTLTHRGHASIGTEEEKATPAPVNKSSIYLLQRWAAFTCHDPYFTGNMREWLYRDSPTPSRMLAQRNSANEQWTRDVLFISHELTSTGAPIVLAHLAKWLRQHSIFAVVMSPEDGPLRDTFVKADIPLLIDPLLATGFDTFTKFGRGSPVQSHQSFIKFARDFDCVVASTLFAAPLIRDARIAGIPHIWWLHEGVVGEHFLKRFPRVGGVLELADLIVAPDKASSRIYQPFASRAVRLLPQGIPDLAASFPPPPRAKGPLQFLLLGTVEQRKGHRVFLSALSKLPREVLERCQFLIVGRPHDPELTEEIRAATKTLAQLRYREGVSHSEAIEFIRHCDVMVCTSSDETGPLTLIEATALGKPILTTPVGVIGENLVAGKDAIFVEAGDAEALAGAIERLARNPELLVELAVNAGRAYKKHFSLERFGSQFVELLDEAAGAQPVGRARISEAMAGQLVS